MYFILIQNSAPLQQTLITLISPLEAKTPPYKYSCKTEQRGGAHRTEIHNTAANSPIETDLQKQPEKHKEATYTINKTCKKLQHQFTLTLSNPTRHNTINTKHNTIKTKHNSAESQPQTATTPHDGTTQSKPNYNQK